MKNQRDKNRQIHGLWEWYHSSGELSCRGHYRNGAAHGLWEWYYSSGKPLDKGAFERGKPAGLWYSSTR